MKKGLLLPLLIPVFAFAAVKGYLWFQVKRFVDQVAEQTAAFVTIEYESIETSFEGRAGISNVRLYPIGSDYPLQIANISVLSNNWAYFMKLGTPLDEGTLPDSLRLEINGVEFDLNSPYAEQWGRLSTAVGAVMLGCEKSELQAVDLLKQLGFSSLLTDIAVAYRFSPQSEYLSTTMELSVYDGFEFYLSSDIELGASSLNRDQLKQLQPKLGGLSIRYKDDSYNQKRIDYCAGLNGQSITAFIDHHVQLTAEQYRQFGFVFNDALVDAYRQFMSEGGEARLTLTADEALGLQELMLSSPAEQLQRLDVGLAVNGKAVVPVELGWSKPAELNLATSLAQLGNSHGAELAVSNDVADPPVAQQRLLRDAEVQVQPLPLAVTESPANAAPASPPAPRIVYRTTALSEAGAYVGSAVRVYTHNGHRIDGEIVQVLKDRILLRQNLGNGVAELPIIHRHINQLKVLR